MRSAQSVPVETPSCSLPVSRPITAPTPDACEFASLMPVTEEARKALGSDLARVGRLPFRVGRNNRKLPGKPALAGRWTGLLAANDLYLDEAEPYQISRVHFQIEKRGEHFFIIDRNSQCGTIVDGRRLGGNRTGGRARLYNNSTITLGIPHSPYVFRFRIPPHAVADDKPRPAIPSCPDCGGTALRRSHRRTLAEYFFSAVRIYPLRCLTCHHRFRGRFPSGETEVLRQNPSDRLRGAPWFSATLPCHPAPAWDVRPGDKCA